MREHDDNDLTSDSATNDRCPYCGCQRGDMLEPYEDHVLDCQPASL